MLKYPSHGVLESQNSLVTWLALELRFLWFALKFVKNLPVISCECPPPLPLSKYYQFFSDLSYESQEIS